MAPAQQAGASLVWTVEEDELLTRLILQYGVGGKSQQDWEAIAAALPHRSLKACQNRWSKHLGVVHREQRNGKASKASKASNLAPLGAVSAAATSNSHITEANAAMFFFGGGGSSGNKRKRSPAKSSLPPPGAVASPRGIDATAGAAGVNSAAFNGGTGDETDDETGGESTGVGPNSNGNGATGGSGGRGGGEEDDDDSDPPWRTDGRRGASDAAPGDEDALVGWDVYFTVEAEDGQPAYLAGMVMGWVSAAENGGEPAYQIIDHDGDEHVLLYAETVQFVKQAIERRRLLTLAAAASAPTPQQRELLAAAGTVGNRHTAANTIAATEALVARALERKRLGLPPEKHAPPPSQQSQQSQRHLSGANYLLAQQFVASATPSKSPAATPTPTSGSAPMAAPAAPVAVTAATAPATAVAASSSSSSLASSSAATAPAAAFGGYPANGAFSSLSSSSASSSASSSSSSASSSSSLSASPISFPILSSGLSSGLDSDAAASPSGAGGGGSSGGGGPGSRPRTDWGAEEDQFIGQWVAQYGSRRWTDAAAALSTVTGRPMRTGKSCRERWCVSYSDGCVKCDGVKRVLSARPFVHLLIDYSA